MIIFSGITFTIFKIAIRKYTVNVKIKWVIENVNKASKSVRLLNIQQRITRLIPITDRRRLVEYTLNVLASPSIFT